MLCTYVTRNDLVHCANEESLRVVGHAVRRLDRLPALEVPVAGDHQKYGF